MALHAPTSTHACARDRWPCTRRHAHTHVRCSNTYAPRTDTSAHVHAQELACASNGRIPAALHSARVCDH
eukprot:3051627-Pleurochrysis_carterae.AAC.1